MRLTELGGLKGPCCTDGEGEGFSKACVTPKRSPGFTCLVAAPPELGGENGDTRLAGINLLDSFCEFIIDDAGGISF